MEAYADGLAISVIFAIVHDLSFPCQKDKG